MRAANRVQTNSYVIRMIDLSPQITRINSRITRTHFRSQWSGLTLKTMAADTTLMQFSNITKTSRLTQESPNSNSHLVAARACEIHTTYTRYSEPRTFRRTRLTHSSSRAFRASQSSRRVSAFPRKAALSRSQLKTIGGALQKAHNLWKMHWRRVAVREL